LIVRTISGSSSGGLPGRPPCSAFFAQRIGLVYGVLIFSLHASTALSALAKLCLRLRNILFVFESTFTPSSSTLQRLSVFFRGFHWPGCFFERPPFEFSLLLGWLPVFSRFLEWIRKPGS
jgi:hypothetical protein